MRLHGSNNSSTIAFEAASTTGRSSGEVSTGHVDIYISTFDATGRSVWFVHLRRDADIPKGETQAGTFNETTELHFRKAEPYRVIVAVRDQVSEAVRVIQRLVRL